jgi:hypothetical protein
MIEEADAKSATGTLSDPHFSVPVLLTERCRTEEYRRFSSKVFRRRPNQRPKP